MADLTTTGNLAAGMLLVISAALWVKVLASLALGRAPLVLEPREPAPWHPFTVGLALPVTIVVRLVLLSSIRFDDPPTIVNVRGMCLVMTLESAVLMGLLALGTPIRASDFGLHPSRVAKDVTSGLCGFLLAWLPVFLVNYAVGALGLRAEGAEHSFFKVLRSDSHAETVAWLLLTVVVVAPLAEELLYRVVLQGWLETRISPLAAVLFVSILFASVHSGDGRPDALPLFPLAFILGYVYYRTHSYLAAVVLHASFNAVNLLFAILMGGN